MKSITKRALIGVGAGLTAIIGIGIVAVPRQDSILSPPAVGHAITYRVTGSPAYVTYGPAGSDLSGAVPMEKTVAQPGRAPNYYAVSAQLKGSGSVTCWILVDGKVVSSSVARGSYNPAVCEIVPDFTGGWKDANSG